MTVGVAIAFAVFGLICIVLTVIGLPGTWFILAAALSIEHFYKPLFGWWAIGIALALCIIAEVAETLSGAAGAAAAGASRRASLGAILGGLIGALLGTVMIPIPLVGTILGGVFGAAGAAMLMEVSLDRSVRTSTSVVDVGKGAAVGRLMATLIKGGFCLAIALVLIIASTL